MQRREFIAASAALALPLITGNLVDSFAGPLPAQPSSRPRRPATGPLHKHPDNPRYFAHGEGQAVLLTGSHTWNSLVDVGESDPPPNFDFDAYLDFLDRYHHNFIRLWTWETTNWDTRGASWGGTGGLNRVAPHPWARTGEGTALDGKPKFDLEKYDPAYFQRLRSRVAAAGNRGIYVSIMLFEGWALQFADKAWEGHPMNPANNINKIGGDWSGDRPGVKVHELGNHRVTQRSGQCVV